MERWIDLNADVGEDPAALAGGSEERLLRLVTSANIACGGHAGTPASMEAVVAIARRLGVAIGAHPSYPDREGFGRGAMSISEEELQKAIAAQVRALAEVAARQGASLVHVKPHGALYNVAARDARVAGTIARAVRAWRAGAVLVGLAGSSMLEVWRREGFRVAAEAFADRRYEPDGTLRARHHPDALVTEPAEAAAQAVEIVEYGRAIAVTGVPVPLVAETLCVHGDTPHALEILRAVRRELSARGVRIASLGSLPGA